jgi:hypothetical protein
MTDERNPESTWAADKTRSAQRALR